MRIVVAPELSFRKRPRIGVREFARFFFSSFAMFFRFCLFFYFRSIAVSTNDLNFAPFIYLFVTIFGGRKGAEGRGINYCYVFSIVQVLVCVFVCLLHLLGKFIFCPRTGLFLIGNELFVGFCMEVCVLWECVSARVVPEKKVKQLVG